jgi:hypothetical protein
MLFPAGMLILLVLAAIAFDFSIAYQRKRALLDLAATSAADAATSGLDGNRLRASGRYCLDASRARAAVEEDVAATDAAVTVVDVDIESSAGDGCATTVRVTLATTTPAFFARVVPGTPRDRVIEATMRATAVER